MTFQVLNGLSRFKVVTKVFSQVSPNLTNEPFQLNIRHLNLASFELLRRDRREKDNRGREGPHGQCLLSVLTNFNMFLGCLDFGKREQDTIIKPASMTFN